MSSHAQMKRRGATFPYCGVGVVVCVLWVLAFPRQASANATIFVNTSAPACPYGYCVAASQFGVLVGPGDTVNFTGTDTILNDIGIANTARITTTNAVTIGSTTNHSIIDFADTNMTNSAVPCTGNACTSPTDYPATFSANTMVYGGTQTNQQLVSDAYAQFQSISSYWQAQTSTSLPGQALSGNWNIENTAGTGTGGTVHVFNTTGYNPTGAVTIGCGTSGATDVTKACNPNDLLVIVIPSGTVSIGKDFKFAPSSGLTDDQVLFLIEGNGSVLSLTTHNSTITIHGDFFLTGDTGSYVIGDKNNKNILYGRVFAESNGNSTLTWNQGVTLYDEDPIAAPEPGTWAFAAFGLAVGAFCLRRSPVPHSSGGVQQAKYPSTEGFTVLELV